MRYGMQRARWLCMIAAFAAVFAAGVLIGRTITTSGSAEETRAFLFPEAYAQEPESEQVPDIIERVVPAVVNISSKKVVKLEGSQAPSFFNDPFFRRFFGDDMSRFFSIPRERIERNLGSGVIVSGDGYILTNNHLVERAENIQVVLPDKREFDAEVVGTDPRTDVAVLRIKASGLPTVPIGGSSDLRLGQTVLAIGYPFGIGQTVTRGIISALGRSNLNLVDYEDFIQTDASINPGNSGGALINTRGELIGINTAMLSNTGAGMGIGFAIPIDLANSVMESIIENGRVIRGYLGVWLQDVDPQMAEEFGLPKSEGVIISDVKADGPADKAGIKTGDVVLMYGDRKVENMTQFRNLVARSGPGSKADVEIFRDGKTKRLTVTVGEYPEDEEEAKSSEESAESPLFLGVGLETLSDSHRRQLDIPSRIQGVVVTEINRNSAAAESGLAAGDVIMQVNRENVENIQDFRRIISGVDRKDRLLLFIYRGGRTLYLILKD